MVGIFQFSYNFYVNKNGNISSSGITRSAEAATRDVTAVHKFHKISQYSQEKDWVRVSLLKKTLTRVLSCEHYKIFKNTCFEENLSTAACCSGCLFYHRAIFTNDSHWLLLSFQ